jgi:putative hydrolase of the HAD superfamily
LILVEGELGHGKPDARVFQKALAFFELCPEKTTMVGDRLLSDIMAAQAVGIPGVWHDCYGEGVPPDAPSVPDRVIRQIAELV